MICSNVGDELMRTRNMFAKDMDNGFFIKNILSIGKITFIVILKKVKLKDFF